MEPPSGDGVEGWNIELNGGLAFFLPPTASWCDAKIAENPAGSVFEEDTRMHVHTHTHTHTEPWGEGVSSLAHGFKFKFKFKQHGSPYTPKQSGEGSSAPEFNAGSLCNF